MVMLVRPVHPEKAFHSMLVTLFGMVKDLNFFPSGYVCNKVLFLLYNTPSWELYTLLPAETFIAVRLVQYKKAISMVVTLSGTVTLVRLVQPEKAPTLMAVTLFGMVTLVRFVQK
jgi:hypothetical protein